MLIPDAANRKHPTWQLKSGFVRVEKRALASVPWWVHFSASFGKLALVLQVGKGYRSTLKLEYFEYFEY